MKKIVFYTLYVVLAFVGLGLFFRGMPFLLRIVALFAIPIIHIMSKEYRKKRYW